MNIEIKISGETTDAKFLAVLTAISAITGGVKHEGAAPVVTMGTAIPVETQAVTFAETPHDTSKPAQAAPKKEKPTAKSKYTLEVVRAEAIALSKSGKREEVKALIATHGGEKVTDLSADVYDAFMADLAKLK